MKKQEMNSKYLCYLLRHAPSSVGLDMDKHGWVRINQLIENVNAKGKVKLTRELIEQIVETDDKGRYRISSDGEHIKACQGHSIPWVEPELERRNPPKYLYHGTTAEAFCEIERCGAVLKMSRHAVHLHADELMAWQVACRRKNKTPIVLKIDSGTMSEQGIEFNISENEIWFCERIPIKYITKVIDDTDLSLKLNVGIDDDTLIALRDWITDCREKGLSPNYDQIGKWIYDYINNNKEKQQ